VRSLPELLSRWEHEKVDPLPGEPAEAVHIAFAKLGVHATSDVVRLYSEIGGMRMMNEEYWRLWPLAEVAAQRPSPHGVLFSDYCISCWEYRLKPTGNDRSAVYVDHHNSKPPVLLASSLDEFFQRYLADARSLLDLGSG
jgi:hypothetical protein